MSEPETQDRNSGSLHCYPPLAFGSLFAGIGGFDLGFERAGMVCKWQVEIDDYANRVLEKHWPSVHRERDVRTVGRHNLEAVDVMCGGFPCVNISSLGDRSGIDGNEDGSGLWFEAVRIIREIRPQFFVMENVSALLIRGADRVFGDLAESGYDIGWRCLPAALFRAPHRRDRVFAIAIDRNTNGGNGSAIETFSNKDASTCGDGAGSWWEVEPGVGRVAHGVSNRSHRLRGLGNAVVPQVAEWIGRRIVESAGRMPAPACQCR